MKKLLVFFLMVFMTISLFAQSEKLLTVLFTNDSHGMAWKFDEPGNPGIGGIAAQKTLVDQIRAEVQGKGGSILVLSAGDITLGDPRSNICQNVPLIKGMNLIGYDGMAIGNHEFDFGLKTFFAMKKEANFPFLSANIYDKENFKPVGKEYFEKKMDNGIKVAVIGFTTRETEQITGSGLEGKLIMTDPVQEAVKRVPLLKKNNDIIIALSHLGFYDSDKSFDGYNSDSFLAKQAKDIDLIIGGHTQKHITRPVKIGKTHLVQTEGYGKWLGRFDFYLKGKKVVKTDFKLYPINLKDKKGKLIGKEIKENQAVLDMLNGFKCDFSTDKIGEAEVDFTGSREIVRHKETELGDMIADVMREKAKSDVALLNAGSIRMGIKKGAVSERDVYNVFPFNDTLVIAKVKGSVLQDALDLFAGKGKGSGGFLQASGLSTKILKGNALEIKINGQKLDPNKFYTVAINSFMADGGDGYQMFADHKGKKDTGYSIPSIIVDYIKKHKKLKKPVMGRIDYLD